MVKEDKKKVLLVVGVVILLVGIVYAVGGIQSTHDDQGRQLYSANLYYRANNPVWTEGYLSEIEISDYEKQKIIGLYMLPMTMWIDNEYTQDITVTCEGKVVFHTQSETVAREGSYGEEDVTLKNLPAGASCTLKIDMICQEDNDIKDQEIKSFAVPSI